MNMQSDTDYETVTVLRKKAPKPSQLRSEQAINAAQRAGVAVETSKKFTASQNKQHVMTKNAAKLEAETEELHHETISLDVGRVIQQGRQAKEWSQKDLAQRVNEKPSVINDYEAGRAVPNQQVLGKIERAIGLRLRGKQIGQAFEAKDQKGKK